MINQVENDIMNDTETEADWKSGTACDPTWYCPVVRRAIAKGAEVGHALADERGLLDGDELTVRDIVNLGWSMSVPWMACGDLFADDDDDPHLSRTVARVVAHEGAGSVSRIVIEHPLDVASAAVALGTYLGIQNGFSCMSPNAQAAFHYGWDHTAGRAADISNRPFHHDPEGLMYSDEPPALWFGRMFAAAILTRTEADKERYDIGFMDDAGTLDAFRGLLEREQDNGDADSECAIRDGGMEYKFVLMTEDGIDRALKDLHDDPRYDDHKLGILVDVLNDTFRPGTKFSI